MCVPKQNTPAIAPPDDATPAATALALGTVNPANAGLGRLSLRMNKTPAASPSTTTASGASTTTTTSVAPNPLSLTPTPVAPAGEGLPVSGTNPYVTDLQLVPNKALRLRKDVD